MSNTQQVFVQTKQNVSAGDTNAISALIFQNFKDFNHNIFQENDCVINGLQILAPGTPTTGSVTVKAGNAFYNSPNTTTTVPFANPVLSLSFKGSVISISTDVVQPITTPHPINQRTDAIDIQYTENQDTPASRAFVQTGGTVILNTVNTKTTSNIPLTGGAGSVINYSQGTPGTPTSSTPPAIPAGYIRLATIVVLPGATFNITQGNITSNGTTGTTGVTGTLPRIWEQQTWPTGSNAPNAPNTFDQSNTLADSLSAIRAQLNSIIGIPGGSWFNAPEISLHALTSSQSAFIKQGADIRSFSMDNQPGTFADDLGGGGGLNNKGIVIGRGLIGFPDGVVRRNSNEKWLDLSQAFAPGFAGLSTASQTVGFVDTFPVSQPSGSSSFLQPNSLYAVFAIADHAGTDFNVICSKIPYFPVNLSVSGTQTTATPQTGSFSGFYPNRTLVRMALDPTTPGFVWGPGSLNGGNFDLQDLSAIGAVTSSSRQTAAGNINTAGTVLPSGNFGVTDMPMLSVATASTLTTQGSGLTAPLTGNGTGSVLALGGFKPAGFNRFRYLGGFKTDNDGRVHPFRREGNHIYYTNPIFFFYVYFGFGGGGQNSGFTVDCGQIIPGTAQAVKLHTKLSIDTSSGAGGNGTQIVGVRVYFRRDGGMPFEPFWHMTTNGILVNGVNQNSWLPNYPGDAIKLFDQPTVQGTFKTWVFNDFGSSGTAYHGFLGTLNMVCLGYVEDIFDEWRRQ